MKKSKKWMSVIPSAVLLFSLTGCILAEGTYRNVSNELQGIALEDKTPGYFVYRLQTRNNTQTFSALSVSFANSRIRYSYGLSNVRIQASLSKTEAFAEGDTETIHSLPGSGVLSPGFSDSSLTLSFDQDELTALRATTLYLRVEINPDSEDATFDPSWIILGNMTVAGGERLETGDTEERTYFSVNFAEDSLDSAAQSDNLEIITTGDVPGLTLSDLAASGYVTYPLETLSDANSFQSLKVRITNSMLKDYVYEIEDETTGEPIQRVGKVTLSAYVGTSVASFSDTPTASVVSTAEGITEAELDLTSGVARISGSQIFVRLMLQVSDYNDDEDVHISLGQLEFMGEESQNIPDYLVQNFTENGLTEALESDGMITRRINAVHTSIALKGGSKCQVQRIEYDEDGNEVSTYTSTVCTWGEKGPGYTNDWVARMTSNQLAIARNAYSLGSSIEEGVAYEGTATISGSSITVQVYQVTDYADEDDNVYEMIYRLGDITNLNTAVQAEARKFTDDVFRDYNPSGRGNVVYIVYDGIRNLYVHNGNSLQGTDLVIYRK